MKKINFRQHDLTENKRIQMMQSYSEYIQALDKIAFAESPYEKIFDHPDSGLSSRQITKQMNDEILLTLREMLPQYEIKPKIDNSIVKIELEYSSEPEKFRPEELLKDVWMNHNIQTFVLQSRKNFYTFDTHYQFLFLASLNPRIETFVMERVWKSPGAMSIPTHNTIKISRSELEEKLKLKNMTIEQKRDLVLSVIADMRKTFNGDISDQGYFLSKKEKKFIAQMQNSILIGKLNALH